jgi:predicted O-methyltransferase YrrM
MSITDFLNARRCHVTEGYSQQVPKQVGDLINLAKGAKINIMEIGFNAGHSADIFLKNNPSITLTSFDLGCHSYVYVAKEYIDATYPNRHTLIIGDSTVTVPKYINDNPDKTFDLIFIDGGHDYSIAKVDLENCSKLAHKETIVAMDDTIHTKQLVTGWTIGPTRTWNEHLISNTITEINRADYETGRGMSWGKYVM